MQLQLTCLYLHALASTRGSKIILRFYPHSARQLEPAVLGLLQCLSLHSAKKHRDGRAAGLKSIPWNDRTTDGVSGSAVELADSHLNTLLGVMRSAAEPVKYQLLNSFDADEDELLWRVECTLLLWLQNLLIIPFDLSCVDSLDALLKHHLATPQVVQDAHMKN